MERFPTAPTSGQDEQPSELAQWVTQVRQRNQSISSNSPASPITNTTITTTSSAAELEDEFQRQRLERQNRRSRLSISGVRGISASNSPVASPAKELPNPIATMNTSGDSQAPNLGRANSLLSRYGGQYGPTGVAAGPRNAGDAPVSLASFMGGKAAGPRLGKLSGDGRSTPPEAEQIHESRWAPPSRTTYSNSASSAGARPLASFLEDRAKSTDTTGNSASDTASTSPAKYSSFLERARSHSSRRDTEPSNAAPLAASPPKQFSVSPTKASSMPAPISSTFSSSHRSSSPDKAWDRQSLRSPVKSAVDSNSSARAAATPIKASAAPSIQIPHKPYSHASFVSPRKDVSTSPLKPEDVPLAKTVAASPASSKLLAGQQQAFSSPRTDRFSKPTSPLLDEGTLDARTPSAQSPNLSTSDSCSSQFQSAAADRIPTASLTRLSAKKMVGQRIREAQERDALARKESESMGAGHALGSTPHKSATSSPLPINSPVKGRWPDPSSTSLPSTTSENERKRIGGWSPTKIGNALPGLTGRAPNKDSTRAVPSSSPPKRTYEDDTTNAHPAPVRLPGMGAESSPFKRFSAASQAPTRETPTDAPAQEDVLQPLTKGRARGPTRRPGASTGPASTSSVPSGIVKTALEREVAPAPEPSPAPGSPKKAIPIVTGTDHRASSPASPTKRSSRLWTKPASPTKPSFSAQEAPTAVDKANIEPVPTQAPTKPPRCTAGKRIHVLVSGSGSNLQALIDATLLSSAGGPVIPNATISFVLSNRKAAYGLTRAKESNPPIPTKVLALKTWQNRNPGGTREQYDQVLARAVLDGPAEEGQGSPPDLVVLAGFMHIVSEPFLHGLGHKTSLPASTPTVGPRPSKPVPIINLHPALPGAFDGANAIPRAFEAFQQGLVDRTGCMIHEVVAEVDRGRPLIVREVYPKPDWTLERLEEEIHKIEHIIIVEGARQVLEGRLDELDREEALNRQKEQEAAARMSKPLQRTDLNETVHIRSRENGHDAIATAHRVLRASSFKGSSYVMDSKNSATKKRAGLKTVSVETISISSDGSTQTLGTVEQGGLSERQLIYEDETLAIVHRFKAANGLIETQVFIWVGAQSSLHPLSGSSFAPNASAEASKAKSLASRYGVDPILVPAGLESSDLIQSLGGDWAVARQGPRSRFDVNGTGLYRVRGSVSPENDAMTIQQLDLRTSNLCSADSFVVSILSSYIIWHGRGASPEVRAAARRFAQALQTEAGSSKADAISEEEEGHEEGVFWDLFDQSEAYASSWYHRLSGERAPIRLHDVRLERGAPSLVPAIEPDHLSLVDLMRDNQVSLLDLAQKELFVIVGRKARTEKTKIALGCLIAEQIANAAPQHRPAVHVLVMPSKIPREVRAAARLWSDAAQDSVTKMNLLTCRAALEDLKQSSWPRWRLRDPDFLPIGVGEEDSK